MFPKTPLSFDDNSFLQTSVTQISREFHWSMRIRYIAEALTTSVICRLKRFKYPRSFHHINFPYGFNSNNAVFTTSTLCRPILLPVSQKFSPHEFPKLTRLRYHRGIHYNNYPHPYVTKVSQELTVLSDSLEFLTSKLIVLVWNK